MKVLLYVKYTVFSLFFLSCKNEANEEKKVIKIIEKDTIIEVENSPNYYDSIMAQKLGADDYGMHQYVMAFLKKGPNSTRDSTHAAELQKAHMVNISRMAKEGVLVLAGPFLDDGDLRGIYVFDVKTIEEAKALTASDPAIQFGSLKMELHPWYGSAALMKVNEIHENISKIKF